MAKVDTEIASLRAGQRRLFAELDELKEEIADVREALRVRDKAIARLTHRARAVHVELELERLRRDGELPERPREPELELA